MNKIDEIQKTQMQKLSFRNFLQEELVKRCRKNPGYSLRAFARSLRVEPSALSQMINGKRPITRKMKLRLGSALGLTVHDLTAMPTDSDDLVKDEYKTMDLDTFAFISDWYYFAILELTHVQGFQSNPGWISKRLGITKAESTLAIQRLFRLGLLKEADGIFTESSESGKLTSLHPSLSSGAARNYQIQLLELSKKSVENDPLDVRNHTSATLCFNSEDLPRAIEAIAKFRREFAKEFQPKNQDQIDEVYQIQVSLFPLTKNKELI